MTELTEREVKLIELSRVYARDFPDCGAPGHSTFILIAKLSEGLPMMYKNPSPKSVDFNNLEIAGGHIRGL